MRKARVEERGVFSFQESDAAQPVRLDVAADLVQSCRAARIVIEMFTRSPR